MSDKPRILVLDTENAPALVNVWALWNQNIGINQIVADKYLMCWCAKWWGDDVIMADALPYHKKHYKLYPEDDLKICETLWALVDEADVVVAHNGDRHDLPLMNSRFVHHGMKPPAPAKQIDTYKIAKSVFGFTSNKLDWLGEHLGVGRKVHHDGFDLWRRCMIGDRESWDTMVEYCRGDVALLERVWDRLRPWAKNHPDLTRYTDGVDGCPSCLGGNFKRDGHRYTLAGMFQRYMCTDCGKRWSSSTNLLSKDERAATKRSGHDA